LPSRVQTLIARRLSSANEAMNQPLPSAERSLDAFSRMYLGRYWPSDTAASAALATAWNATLITFLRSGNPQ
jgi:hypothetical protein